MGCTIGIVSTGVGLYFARYLLRNEPGIVLPNELDFLDSIGYALLYTVIRYVFDELCRDFVYRRVKITDPINFEMKKDKTLKEAFCSIWYLAMTILGLCFFANTDSLPTPCFGSGNCEDMASRAFVRENHWTVRMYFMIQFAYHCHTLVYYELANRKKKLLEYNEMMLHHILAVGLIILCYTSGFFNYGISFLMIADGTDFFLNIAKAERDLVIFQIGNFRIIDILFAGLALSWTWFRAVVLPGCVLRSCYIALWKIIKGEMGYFEHPAVRHYLPRFVAFYALKVLLLSILGILNFYWVFIILKIAFGRVFLKRKSYANTTHGDELQTDEREKLKLKDTKEE